MRPTFAVSVQALLDLMANTLLPNETADKICTSPSKKLPRLLGKSEAQMCVRRFSAEGDVGNTRWMTGGHHVLEEADTHRRETLDFAQQRNQLHMYRVTINSSHSRFIVFAS